MPHKIVMLKSDAHYMGTTVNFERSLSQIQAMLEKHGCTRIANQKDIRGEYPLISLLFEKDNIPYLIDFPVIYEEKKRGPKELRMDVSARVIHDRIKALLIEQEMNLMDFSQAMMQFLALPDGHGGMTMMQDRILEQYDQLSQGTFDIKYALPAAKNI